MIREIIIAARFGTGETYDAYVAAFRVPDLLFFLVMSGAFGSAFIPIFSGYLAKGDEHRAWKLASALITWGVIVLLVIGQVIFFVAEPLIGSLIAPELAPEAQDLAVNLTRLLLLSPLLLGLGAAARGMLESFDSFALPAVAPIIYNIGIIFGALTLVPHFGIYGLVAGVIAGAAGHAGIQFLGLLRRGVRLRPSFDLQTDGLREVVSLMLPRLFGQSASQLNLIIMTNFASRLGEGRISALNYAQYLALLPHGVIALSISTVVFPLMARQFAVEQASTMRSTLHQAITSISFFSVPAAVGLFVFRKSIVQVTFQYGSFSSESRDLVAAAVGFFAIGIIGRAMVEPLTRAFYAMRDTRTPVLISLAAIGFNVLLSWLLAPRMGHEGLALSISVTAYLRMTLLLLLLSRQTGGLVQVLSGSLAKMVVAAGPMLLIGLLLAEPLATATDPAHGRSIIDYLGFGMALLLTGGSYLLVAHLLKIDDVQRVTRLIRRAGRVIGW